MIPASSKVGDSIYIFPGASITFVLRSTGSSYELIGQCYEW
jgi:hypothetical protein